MTPGASTAFLNNFICFEKSTFRPPLNFVFGREFCRCVNANIRVWSVTSCSISFIGVVTAVGGAEVVAFSEKGVENGVVCADVDAVVGGATFGVVGVVAQTSGVVLVDAAFLVASIMLFLASLNCISTFPISAFNKRNCVSIDSFSAAALALFAFFFDADFPDGAVVVAAASSGAAIC